MRPKYQGRTKRSPDDVGAQRRAAPDPDRWVPLPPSAADIGLLRAYLAKRAHLDPIEIQMAESFLEQAVKRPLSPKQRAWLERHAKMVGAVYEEPPTGVLKQERWGTLPLRPPGRLA